MRAFYRRINARRGFATAVVATARKLTVQAWHLATKDQDYAFARARVLMTIACRRRQNGWAKLATAAPVDRCLDEITVYLPTEKVSSRTPVPTSASDGALTMRSRRPHLRHGRPCLARHLRPAAIHH